MKDHIDEAWHEMIDARDAEIQKLKHLIARLSKALIKVRPLGGSELFIKVGEEYFADPEYCGAAIGKLHHDLHACRRGYALLSRKDSGHVTEGEAQVAIDIEGAEIEAMYWKPTGELRWFRPARADDTQRVLQQLWERVTGERSWRDVPVCLAD